MLVPLLTNSSRLAAQAQGLGIYAEVDSSPSSQLNTEVINCHYYFGSCGQRLLSLPTESSVVIEDYSLLESILQQRFKEKSFEKGGLPSEFNSARPQLISGANLTYEVTRIGIQLRCTHYEYVRIGSRNLPVDVFLEEFPQDPLAEMIRKLPNLPN